MNMGLRRIVFCKRTQSHFTGEAEAFIFLGACTNVAPLVSKKKDVATLTFFTDKLCFLNSIYFLKIIQN